MTNAKIKRCYELMPETLTAFGHKADGLAALDDDLVNAMIKFCCRDTQGDFYRYWLTGQLAYDYRPTTHQVDEADIDKLYALADRYNTTTDAIITKMIRYHHRNEKGLKKLSGY